MTLQTAEIQSELQAVKRREENGEADDGCQGGFCSKALVDWLRSNSEIDVWGDARAFFTMTWKEGSDGIFLPLAAALTFLSCGACTWDSPSHEMNGTIHINVL